MIQEKKAACTTARATDKLAREGNIQFLVSKTAGQLQARP
jgi:hypothetical protein